MLRTLCLAMAVLVLPLESSFADARTDSDENAALKYWQAFATLPKFADAENKKLAEVLTTPLDDLARKIRDRRAVLVADDALRGSAAGAVIGGCAIKRGSSRGSLRRMRPA